MGALLARSAALLITDLARLERVVNDAGPAEGAGPLNAFKTPLEAHERAEERLLERCCLRAGGNPTAVACGEVGAPGPSVLRR